MKKDLDDDDGDEEEKCEEGAVCTIRRKEPLAVIHLS